MLNQNRTNGVILVFILGNTLYFVVSSFLGVKATPLKFPNRGKIVEEQIAELAAQIAELGQAAL